jgi:hypothetical protein
MGALRLDSVSFLPIALIIILKRERMLSTCESCLASLQSASIEAQAFAYLIAQISAILLASCRQAGHSGY